MAERRLRLLTESMAHPGTELSFFKDVKGDRDNLTYESIHKYSVPRYRRAGRGNLLGLGREFTLHSNRKDGKVSQQGLDTAQRSRGKQLLAASDPVTPEVLIGENSTNDELKKQSDFIAFDSKRQKNSRNDSQNELEEFSFEEDEQPEQLQGGDAQDAYGSFRTDHVQQRLRQLQQKISQQPQELSNWLELADLQQQLASPGAEPSMSLRLGTIPQMKISVYEEALDKIEDKSDRVALISRLMREGAKIWGPDRKAQMWTKLLADTSPELEILHLDFRQLDRSNFSVNRVLEVCTRRLESCLFKSSIPEWEKTCVHLVLRASLLLEQSGYVERSIAIWQALLEYNYCAPEIPTGESKLSAFQQFWESEVLRLGEGKATGWSSQLANTVPEPKKDDVISSIHYNDDFPDWALAEKLAESHLPARTIDTTSERDPFRVVLFEDIKSFIFDVPSNEGRVLLLDAFACYGGLPAIRGRCRQTPWRLDPFCWPRSFDMFPGQTSRMEFTGLPDTASLYALTSEPSSAWTSTQPEKTSAWIYRALQQMALHGRQDISVAEYVVAFGSSAGSPDVSKFARLLVKRSSEPLRLYNSYALAECRAGNFTHAERTWGTILAPPGQGGQTTGNDRYHAWRSWIWENMQQNQHENALTLLLRMSHTNDINTAPQPKSHPPETVPQEAEQKLRFTIFDAFSHGEAGLVALFADLLAFLLYYLHNRDISAASSIYRMTLDLLPGMKAPEASVDEAIETVHQQRARLLHFHASSNGVVFKPREVINLLMESVQAYPNNSVFVNLVAQYTQKYGLLDRLRNMASLDTAATKATPLLHHVQQIAIEMGRPDHSGSNEHSIRAAFIRAFEDEAASFNPALRLAHVKWELDVLDESLYQPSADDSDDFEFRPFSPPHEALRCAIEACPWSKELFMLAFGSPHIRQDAGDNDLDVAYTMMLDRELRLHIHLD